MPPQAAADYLTFAKSTVKSAGSVILASFRVPIDVDNKLSDGGFDPVTIADREGEGVIRKAIVARYPEHGVFGEELGHESGNGLTWVIDPIDGTRAFMTGMLHWGILLALFDGQEPIIGVMYQPFTDELFWGTNDVAGYEHGSVAMPLKARACASLGEAVMTATSPQFFVDSVERAGIARLQDEVKLTRFGGDCYLFAMLAMGFVDIGLEASLKPYDIQPMMPIIRGAGGIVTDWRGGDPSMGGRIIAAGDPRVHAQALEVLGSLED